MDLKKIGAVVAFVLIVLVILGKLTSSHHSEISTCEVKRVENFSSPVSKPRGSQSVLSQENPGCREQTQVKESRRRKPLISC